jgi:DHA1 family bicyclomycin/chloramphenicol resistance-like MFS transporter
MVVGVWLGSALASRLISRVAAPLLLIGANLVSVAAALVLLTMVFVGPLTATGVVGSLFFFTLGAGLASPLALTEAVSVNPRVIGSASGLYGFAQMAIGALCAALSGLGPSPALATALTLAGAAALAQASFWIALRSRAASRRARSGDER